MFKYLSTLSRTFPTLLRESFSQIPREVGDIEYEWTMTSTSIVNAATRSCGHKTLSGDGRTYLRIRDSLVEAETGDSELDSFIIQAAVTEVVKKLRGGKASRWMPLALIHIYSWPNQTYCCKTTGFPGLHTASRNYNMESRRSGESHWIPALTP
ncbi:hypothetical protein AMECASPLE_035312 [Ameca splendens]|uniref:Uncharacterized protein n=1 Tax=Ameca splendens TaxID=208324 RepID=A0ABV0YUV5_9TELE